LDAETSFYLACGLLPISGLLAWAFARAARRLHVIRKTPTIRCRDLPGLGASMVEVNGATDAAALREGEAPAEPSGPLISDLCRIPCVAFNSSITEHWTTTETVRDSKGNTRTVTRHHSATRYSNAQQIAFDVVDDSGRARVNPDGADIDLLAQNAGPAPPDSPAYGVAAHHWNGRLSYDESALPLGQQVYVLAQVTQEHILAKPQNVDAPFIISHHGEKRLASGARWTARITGFLAAAALLGAFACAGHWWQSSGGRFPWQ